MRSSKSENRRRYAQRHDLELGRGGMWRKKESDVRSELGSGGRENGGGGG